MPLPIAALAIASAPSILKGVSGLFQSIKGNKMAKNNPFPTAQVNQNIAKNAAIAEQMAQTGLPQQQYNQALQNMQRNQNGVLTSLGRSANSSAGLASVLRASNDASLNLDVNDAQARMRNQGISMQQRGQLAGEQNRVWDWNNRQKYLQQAQAASAMQGAGKQNMFGALDGLSQVGQSFLAGGGLGSGSGGANQLGSVPQLGQLTQPYQSQFTKLF